MVIWNRCSGRVSLVGKINYPNVWHKVYIFDWVDNQHLPYKLFFGSSVIRTVIGINGISICRI